MKKIILLLSLLCISSIHPNISTPVYAEEIREEQSYLDLSKTTYSIVLDGNGATSGKMTTLLNRVHDKTYALPVNTFKNTGYTFKEWNTSKDGSGQSFQNRSNYTALNSEENQEITLYAIWNPVTYKLSYSMNGGINTLDNPTSYKTGDNLVFSTPEKKGYEFLGWYKERTFKNEVSEVSDFVGNRTLYAKWKPISYPITYQLNQGEFSKKVVNSYTIAQSITLPTPKRNGYKFGGWYTNSECTEKVTSIRKGSCEEKIFYAKWIPCTYKISYVLNGGTNSLNNPGLY
ncbi:MAG: InlB B-repeat-containing protein, partial [Firmicutes bacterium]|nr:InlB B-repeat-containing protein [Bacillota bacterium]